MNKQREETKQEYSKRMDRVLEHIHAGLDEPLNLEKLASVACFSPYHFHRIFSGMVGESVKSYIRRLRLERAALKLMHSDQSITDLAYDAGFKTHEAFTRAFSSMFDISPQQFRKAHKLDTRTKHTHYWKEITMEAECIELTDTEVFFVRHVGPYAECVTAWETLCAWASNNGLMQPEARFLSLCHDDPKVTAPDKIRCDVCIDMQSDITPEAPVSKKTIKGGRFIKSVLRGPYDGLAALYDQLCGQWAPQNGYEIEAKASIEVYLNSPQNTAPQDLITEVYVPIK